MEKITYNGEEYFFNMGHVYDTNFCEVPLIVSQNVLKFYFSKKDYKNLNENDLLEHVKSLKFAELYNDCLQAIIFGLDKFCTSYNFYKMVFPIITSCYRALGQPQKAIDFWMQYKRIFSTCLTVPLLTSLAAAYCDVGNYVLARKCADRAYALQDGSLGYKSELSLVYRRIAKETQTPIEP